MKSSIYNIEKYWVTDILWLIFLISLGFLFLLGSRPLNVPDEARYCEIAREMLVRQDFVTPYLNGIKYFEKPILFYWMQAGALKIFGLSEWSCRLISALMALIGCLSVYGVGRKLFDRKTGLFSAVILSSSILYFALARVVILDMTVSIWLTLSLFSFMMGVYHQKFYYYGIYVFSALAVLTKGLIGIIFPGSIIFLWLLFTSQWGILKRCYLIRGILIFLCITLPWHILVQIKNPEFFHFYFITQQFSRYLTVNGQHDEPMYFYFPILLLGLFPWTGFLYGAVKNIFQTQAKNDNKNKKDTLLFFLISTVFIFVFFSLSHSKLAPYILPCFPFLAIILGKYFSDIINTITVNAHEFFHKNIYLWIGFIVISVIALSLAIALPIYIVPNVTTQFSVAQKWSWIIISLLLLNAVIVPFVFWKRNFLSAFMTQIIFSALFLLSLCKIMNYIYMHSIKDMALILKNQPDSRSMHCMIASYDYYYQDLPFYLERPITIINWNGELEFGKQFAHEENLMITDKEFWPDWADAHKKVFLILPKDLFKKIKKNHLDQHFYLFSESKNDVVMTNIPR